MQPITKEKLEKVYQLSDEILTLNEKISESMITVKEQNGEREQEMERDGKKVKIKEKVLWTEFGQLGKRHDSYKKLYELYPDIFAMGDKTDALSQELEGYCTEQFDINHTRMTIANIFRLIEGMVDYCLDQKTKEILKKAA